MIRALLVSIAVLHLCIHPSNKVDGFCFKVPTRYKSIRSDANSNFKSSNTGLDSVTQIGLSLKDLQYGPYDGSAIDRYYKQRPLEAWERLVEIGSPILGWWILQRYDNITAPWRTEAENQKRLEERAKDLRDAIVQGKSVTFIKSGQALALRPDIVKSSEYIAQLQTLQDEVGTFNNDVAMQMITEELGADANAIFDFNPKLPIASASIGQVYKARLLATNETVAVKVQRPDAISNVCVDMYILRQFAALLKRVRKLRSDMVGIADEFGAQLFQELNYVQEARNCRRFKQLYGSIPGIYVPDVIDARTSRRVLVMEFVEGSKGPWERGGERMLTIGLQCSVLQLLGTGFFHSDPHRGNLLQTPRGELAYLDFGMMAEVPSSKRYAMIAAVLGLVNKDIELVIESVNELEFFAPGTNTEDIISSLTGALLNSTDGSSSSSLNFTKLNQNLNSISDRLPFRLPPFYTLIIRSLTILEGLALFVDPNFRLIRGAYPFIARQILSEPTVEMNQLLRRILITSDQRLNWAKLEQFISISAKADSALEGDFSALQSAQEQSDLAKRYATFSGDSSELDAYESANVTLSVASQMLDYLLSESGSFLREPLITELVETIESVGLTAQSFASIATNRLIPAPSAKPDRQKILRVLQLMNSLLLEDAENRSDTEGVSELLDSIAPVDQKQQQQVGSNARRERRRQHQQRAPSRVATSTAAAESRRRQLSRVTQLLLDFVSDSPVQRLEQLQPLLLQLGVLGSQVIARLVERRARTAIRSIFTPRRVEDTLPGIARLLDFLPK